MDFVPWTSFDRIVARYGGDVRVRSLRCGEQFRIMAFAQMTYGGGCATSKQVSERNPRNYTVWGCAKRWHVRHWPMELRDWRIWADIAAVLVRRARKLYVSDDIGLD